MYCYCGYDHVGIVVVMYYNAIAIVVIITVFIHTDIITFMSTTVLRPSLAQPIPCGGVA